MATPALINSVQPPSNLKFSKNITNYFGELKIDNKNGLLSAGNLQFTSNSTISGYALNINKKSDNTSALTIDNLGSINTNGTITTSSTLISKSLKTNNINIYANNNLNGTPKLTILDTGDLLTSGTIYAKDIKLDSANFISVNADGNVFFANNNAKIGSDGHFETNFTNYIISPGLRNSQAISGNLNTTSTTGKYLTTQNYVDDGLWYIQKQLNLLSNIDVGSLDDFKNILDLFNKLSENNTINELPGIVDSVLEIKISITDVIANSETSIIIDCKSSVWGDACAPLPIPVSFSNDYLFDGWFFQNMVYVPDTTTTTTNNINWYISPNGNNMTISDIQNMYMNIFAISDKALPFISVYTQPKGTNGNSIENIINNFAHSRINYYFNVETPSRSSNTSYCLYTGTEPPLNNYNTTKLICKSTTTANGINKNYVSFNNGNTYDSSIIQSTDKIAYFAICTDSKYTLNDVKFILTSFSLKEKTGTTKFQFNNASVATNFLYNMNLRLNIDMTSISSTQYGESHILDEANNGGTYLEKYKETYIAQ
jgi:hypothetical protein